MPHAQVQYLKYITPNFLNSYMIIPRAADFGLDFRIFEDFVRLFWLETTKTVHLHKKQDNRPERSQKIGNVKQN